MKMNLFPRLMFAVFLFGLILLSIVGVSYVVNKNTLEEWLTKPQAPGKVISFGSNKLYVTDSGSSKNLIVILSGLGISSSEWWNIQNILAEENRVITYDRPGYTWSATSSQAPTAIHLAKQLRDLLSSLGAVDLKECGPQEKKPKLTLIAQNISTEIANVFVGLYGGSVSSVVYIDPLLKPYEPASKISKEWQRELIDQTDVLERALLAARIGFFRFLNITPYDVPATIQPIVLNNIANKSTAEAVLNEYKSLVLQKAESSTCASSYEPRKKLILHSEEKNLDLLYSMEVPQDMAQIIETEWREAASNHTGVPLSHAIESKNSLFAIHLDDPQLVIETVRSLTK